MALPNLLSRLYPSPYVKHMLTYSAGTPFANIKILGKSHLPIRTAMEFSTASFSILRKYVNTAGLTNMDRGRRPGKELAGSLDL
jgi:hypothetical protein